MLKNRTLPSKLENSKDPPNNQTGKSADTSKYRLISLLNTEGKVLEKLLSKKTHLIYTTEYLNENQYGFTPQKNRVHAAMEVKQYVGNRLERGGVAIMVSLDVQGAFDSA